MQRETIHKPRSALVRELDLRGLKCPLPVLRTRKALRGLAPGATLVVTCTDPLAAIDIPHLVTGEGHVLAEQPIEAGLATFHIVKRGAAEGV